MGVKAGAEAGLIPELMHAPPDWSPLIKQASWMTISPVPMPSSPAPYERPTPPTRSELAALLRPTQATLGSRLLRR